MRRLLIAISTMLVSLAVSSAPLALAAPDNSSRDEFDAGRVSIIMRAESSPRPSSSAGDVTFHGSAVETAPKVYLILWGSQWNGNEPSDEASILQSFYVDVGGSSWNKTVTRTAAACRAARPPALHHCQATRPNPLAIQPPSSAARGTTTPVPRPLGHGSRSWPLRLSGRLNTSAMTRRPLRPQSVRGRHVTQPKIARPALAHSTVPTTARL
jgi:hypothetical protein